MAKPNKTIGEHADELLNSACRLKELGYIKDENLYYLLKEACKHHDDGKANKEFQKRVTSEKKINFNPEKEVPHNILSVCYLNPELYTKDEYYCLASAILMHHKYGEDPYSELIKNNESLIKDLLLDEYKCKDLKKSLIKNITGKYVNNELTIKLKGLLHKCDYSASGEYVVEYENDFLKEGLENLIQKWKKHNKSAAWNELQIFCQEHEEDNIIALAPTGMGKTEAGLHWIGNHKGFFVLPIRTAINAIYDRIRNDIIENQHLDQRLGLLHSEALEYYQQNVEDIEVFDYYDKGRNLSLPLNVSTIDQLFGFVFKNYGYELKLMTLAYSKLVIDEIQMYDAELLAYLIYGLKMIHQFGGKIAIITATLPPFIKQRLYTDTGIEFKEKAFTHEQIRHAVNVKDYPIDTEEIIKLYQDNQREKRGNKILVVCNTIKKAQAVYNELKEKDEGLNLHIFHSRFIKKDRAELEKRILEFGKTYADDGTIDKRDGIWITTSVVEVSLDIDFDYLFTELSELSALFQRFGRCNRKGIKEIHGYNCFVYCDNSYVKRGGKGFIDATMYKQSKEAILTVDGEISEKHKNQLLEEYFTTEKMRNSDYMRLYSETMDWLNSNNSIFSMDEERMLRVILSQDIVPKKVYEENEYEIQLLQERLEEINRMLNLYNIDKDIKIEILKERVEIQRKLKSYIVSIPKYEYNNYKKAEMILLGDIKIDKKQVIPIIECGYDEKGFAPLNYKKMQDEVMIF